MFPLELPRRWIHRQLPTLLLPIPCLQMHLITYQADTVGWVGSCRYYMQKCVILCHEKGLKEATVQYSFVLMCCKMLPGPKIQVQETITQGTDYCTCIQNIVSFSQGYLSHLGIILHVQKLFISNMSQSLTRLLKRPQLTELLIQRFGREEKKFS